MNTPFSPPGNPSSSPPGRSSPRFPHSWDHRMLPLHLVPSHHRCLVSRSRTGVGWTRSTSSPLKPLLCFLLILCFSGFQAGYYVRIEIQSMPCEFIKYFNPSFPIILGGLSTQEDTLGFIQVRSLLPSFPLAFCSFHESIMDAPVLCYLPAWLLQGIPLEQPE